MFDRRFGGRNVGFGCLRRGNWRARLGSLVPFAWIGGRLAWRGFGRRGRGLWFVLGRYLGGGWSGELGRGFGGVRLFRGWVGLVVRECWIGWAVEGGLEVRRGDREAEEVSVGVGVVVGIVEAG